MISQVEFFDTNLGHWSASDSEDSDEPTQDTPILSQQSSSSSTSKRSRNIEGPSASPVCVAAAAVTTVLGCRQLLTLIASFCDIDTVRELMLSSKRVRETISLSVALRYLREDNALLSRFLSTESAQQFSSGAMKPVFLLRTAELLIAHKAFAAKHLDDKLQREPFCGLNGFWRSLPATETFACPTCAQPELYTFAHGAVPAGYHNTARGFDSYEPSFYFCNRCCKNVIAGDTAAYLFNISESFLARNLPFHNANVLLAQPERGTFNPRRKVRVFQTDMVLKSLRYAPAISFEPIELNDHHRKAAWEALPASARKRFTSLDFEGSSDTVKHIVVYRIV